MGSKPTIQTVAQMAGVSRGTVDRVLNGRAHVREDVRLRVLEAIRQSGYVSPRDTHQRQFQQAYPPMKLGVLLPNWEGQFRTEVDEGIAQAQAELESTGIQILIRRCETDIPAEALKLLDELTEGQRQVLPVWRSAPPMIPPSPRGSPLWRMRGSPASPSTRICRTAAVCALWDRTSTRQAGSPEGL